MIGTTVLQNGATVNGNGAATDCSGARSMFVEVAEVAGGTATVTLQGSFDGSNWYGLGFQQTDATVAPARSVTALAVAANSRHVYTILDQYPQIRAAISAIAGGANITVKLNQA